MSDNVYYVKCNGFMILIANKILTMVPSALPVNDGAVVLNRGTIIDLGSSASMLQKYPGHRIQNLKNALVMPGLINVHTHLELPPLLDVIRSKNLPDWVMGLIREKRKFSDQDYQTASKHNIQDLVKCGTTCVAEICTHGISPQIVKSVGLRALIFHEVISMGPDTGSGKITVTSRLLSRLRRILNLHRMDTELIKTGLSPHAPYTISETALTEIKRLAKDKNIRMCMHVAESLDEIRLLQGKKSGFDELYKAAGWELSWAPVSDSPFEYLGRLRLLGPNFLAVHAVLATDRDIKLIKKTGASIAHCPRSNAQTKVGRLQLKKLLDEGIAVGLGTDSLASSPNLNLWDEMRYALRIHKRDGICARDMMEIATRGGARCLGMDKVIGTLEPGKKADLIAVPLPGRCSPNPYYDLLRETKTCIMSVVNGKIVHDIRSNR